MEQTWRWFGPGDEATLAHARQAGATGIVSALHDIPYGEVWPVEAIRERKAVIEGDGSLGLRWSVVESVPVHDDIKLGRGDLDRLYDNFCQTLRNLGACGVRTVCYNFLLILDWTRTDLAVPQPGGGTALRMNMHELAAFDVLLLQRPRSACSRFRRRATRCATGSAVWTRTGFPGPRSRSSGKSGT